MGGEPGANSLKSARTVDPYQKRTHTDVNNVPAKSHLSYFHLSVELLKANSIEASYLSTLA